MVRKANAPLTEPEESNFLNPSEGEHLMQVSDVYENDDGTITAKCEVVGGDEEGRSLLHRVNPDDTQKSFFYCRMFLKAIGEPYKGEISIDETRWVGRQFYATVIHNGKYANIDDYNFDKLVDNSIANQQPQQEPRQPAEVQDKKVEIAWDE